MSAMAQEKTPWNPSRKAIERVRNPLPVPTECPHCRGAVAVVGNAEIYGREYGEWPWAYLCRGCGAYVGMHPGTGIPLGTLATEEIRLARKKFKAPFVRLYESGLMDRSEAYRRLAEALGIPVAECHFGWFDAAMCAKAGAASERLLAEARGESQ